VLLNFAGLGSSFGTNRKSSVGIAGVEVSVVVSRALRWRAKGRRIAGRGGSCAKGGIDSIGCGAELG
jgi:hypothetical protein